MILQEYIGQVKMTPLMEKLQKLQQSISIG